jgi:hypothetical protein
LVLEWMAPWAQRLKVLKTLAASPEWQELRAGPGLAG